MRVSFPAATRSRATCATRSGVNPNFSRRCFSGADAPNVSMPMIAPPSPTYRSHPKVDACSIATRAFTDGGSTSSRYSFGWRSNSSQHGMLTTRAWMPRRRELVAGRRARDAPPSRSRAGSRRACHPARRRARTRPSRRPTPVRRPSDRASAGSAATGSSTDASSWSRTRIRQVSTTSFASAGRNTRRPGIARSDASCSTG